MIFNVNGVEVELNGGGNSSILSKVIRNKYEGTQHAYIGVPETLDITQEGISLIFAKRKKTRNRLYVEEEERNYRIVKNGWHDISVGNNGDRLSIFHPVLLDTEPAFTAHGINYYEWSFSDNENIGDWINNEGLEGCGGRKFIDQDDEPTIKNRLLCHTFGIAIVKDGKLITNYAPFTMVYNENQDGYFLRA